MSNLRLVVVTGLSGAGKSEAVHCLEDLGYFCVDNLPPGLIVKFAELCGTSGHVRQAALVVDIRGGEFFDHAVEALADLEVHGFPYEILYLEADNDVLIRRFKETRRRHPLAPQGRVSEAIESERRRLEPLRGRAHRIIDTTKLAPQQLRERLVALFGQPAGQPRLLIQVVSFGFKFGLPLDADLVLDVRFLPNPHYVRELRPLPGSHPEVRAYVLDWPVTQQFLARVEPLFDFLIPQYINEGKSQLTIAIGCTGGRHRSVVVADYLAHRLRQKFGAVSVEHRDLEQTAWEGLVD